METWLVRFIYRTPSRKKGTVMDSTAPIYLVWNLIEDSPKWEYTLPTFHSSCTLRTSRFCCIFVCSWLIHMCDLMWQWVSYVSGCPIESHEWLQCHVEFAFVCVRDSFIRVTSCERGCHMWVGSILNMGMAPSRTKSHMNEYHQVTYELVWCHKWMSSCVESHMKSHIEEYEVTHEWVTHEWVWWNHIWSSMK